MISVIADGLSVFANSGMMSGTSVKTCVDAVRAAHQELSEICKRLQDALDVQKRSAIA